MKDVMLKIKGSTITSDVESEKSEEVIEFITEGCLQHHGNLTRLTYRESEISGMEGYTTSLVITPEKVTMTRRNNETQTAAAEMEFCKGKRVNALYDTPYGSMGMELLTNSITKKFGEVCADDGKTPVPESLSIDYSVSLAGVAEWRQRLDIEILKNN